MNLNIRIFINVVVSLIILISTQFSFSDTTPAYDKTAPIDTKVATKVDISSNFILKKSNQTTTTGSYQSNDKVYDFQGEEQGDGEYRLAFGTQGKIITLLPNLSKRTLEIKSNDVTLTEEDTRIFKEISKLISSNLTSDKTELQHNKLLVGLLEYFSTAPIGHKVPNRIEKL